MLNKNAANEIAHSMNEMLQENVGLSPIEKILSAFELLNNAAELFDSVGNTKCAELITKAIDKFANKLSDEDINKMGK